MKIYSLIDELKTNPNKGKKVGKVGSILIKELKYKTFRFYYILNGYELSLFNSNRLKDLLIKFIKMSEKNNQQKTIEEIKEILERIKE